MTSRSPMLAAGVRPVAEAELTDSLGAGARPGLRPSAERRTPVVGRRPATPDAAAPSAGPVRASSRRAVSRTSATAACCSCRTAERASPAGSTRRRVMPLLRRSICPQSEGADDQLSTDSGLVVVTEATELRGTSRPLAALARFPAISRPAGQSRRHRVAVMAAAAATRRTALRLSGMHNSRRGFPARHLS